MKERPILFSGPMVLAIIKGWKTETRRVIKPQPQGDLCGFVLAVGGQDQSRVNSWTWDDPDTAEETASVHCPYGVVGNRLWVRETFAPARNGDTGEPTVIYRAEWEEKGKPEGPASPGFRWKPSIHMPRWASRLLLEVKAVRVERLQDIDSQGAQEEGLLPEQVALGHGGVATALGQFRDLWERINGKKYPWRSNPWVFVVTFERVK